MEDKASPQKFVTYICNVCPEEDNTGDPCILNVGEADSKWRVAE